MDRLNPQLVPQGFIMAFQLGHFLAEMDRGFDVGSPYQNLAMFPMENQKKSNARG